MAMILNSVWERKGRGAGAAKSAASVRALLGWIVRGDFALVQLCYSLTTEQWFRAAQIDERRPQVGN